VVPILMLRAGAPTEVARHTRSPVYRTTHNPPRMVAAIACSTLVAATMRLQCHIRKGPRLRLARTLMRVRQARIQATRQLHTSTQLRITPSRV
jgi:hypothetical protein